MRGKYLNWIERYLQLGNFRRGWKKFVQVMVCIVVFCTTYALILPAITMEQEYSCGKPAHQHITECYQVISEQTYSCPAPHTHEAACYEGETLICDLEEIGAHEHDESCTIPAVTELICTLEEHTHGTECVPNPMVDVETQEQWEAAVKQVQLTGQWTDDLLAIAKSQLGYRESTENYLSVDGEVRKGYTRYGQWYGVPYGDWDAMFASFCLNYANVPRTAIMQGSDSQGWMDMLWETGLLKTLNERTPEAGELVFFSKNNGTAVHAGIINAVDTEADPETGAGRVARLRIIAGDWEDRVAELSVSADEILACCSMEQARLLHENQTSDAAAPVCRQAETENYTVLVSYSPELVLPEGAELRVTEYARDSEIFRQRCEEAGYELDWLLNIGFFLEDTELELDGTFDVLVTSKQGDDLGQDITHFGAEGAERITGTDASEGVQEGQTAVVFSADGFSDFGGGVAAAAETGADIPAAYAAEDEAISYTFVTADPNQLQEGVDYAIYMGSGGTQTYLGTNLNAISVNSGATWSPYHVGGTWQVATDSLGTDAGAFTWRIIKQSDGSYRIYSPQKNQYLHIDWNSLKLTGDTTKYVVNRNVNGAATQLLHPWNTSSGGNFLRYNRGWTGDMGGSNRATVYFAAVTPEYPNYPHAVHTGDVTINRLRFLNLRGDGSNGVRELAGCTFLITSDAVNAEGKPVYETTIVSGNSPIVQLPETIPVGSYTITEISAAEGYVRDDNPVRQFTVQEQNGKKTFVTNKSIGFFMNHPMNEMVCDKTAQVANYENRIYQVLLEATANLRKYEMDPIDVRLVVDQSNSMLFPSGLSALPGKTVTLKVNDDENDDRIEALGLDKSRMHYIISDPHGTATVWCIWHDGTTWMYQDASYYAKAKHGNVEGYQTPDEQAIFPTDASYYDQPTTPTDSDFTKARSNGGALNKDMTGSGLGTYINDDDNKEITFQIYTATSEFNRLHYLEEALGYLVVELADANPKNRVSLTLFTKVVNHSECVPETELTPDAVTKILDTVDSINTSGGTRQDIALDHVYEEAAHEPKAGYKSFTVLITDGAPVTSGEQKTLGNAYLDEVIDENSKEVYPRIRAEAKKIRENEKSTLMTVALAMDNVDGGSHVLETIASSGYAFAYSDAAQLIDALQELVYRSFTMREEIPVEADLVDEISDSFYPVAWVNSGDGLATGRQVLTQETGKDWILLRPGDWITLDGKYTSGTDAAGQLLQREDGTFYVQWKNRNVTNGWKGSVYIKAKEDFIGGNAIDTNKEAYLSYADEETKEVRFETPTVNVRLLDMNEMNSEVTVYLGDTINELGSSPLQALQYFYENTKFTKLVTGSGDVLNAVATADGLEEAVFYLRYAMGRDLAPGEWDELMAGRPVIVEYTYDSDSSHGPVGYFTFTLEKSGDGADYNEHTATHACQPGGTPSSDACTAPVETYTLKVTYSAYALGEQGRPDGNKHNAPAGPGTEVGSGETLPTGKGVVTKRNVHEVHVISGVIQITKKLDKAADEDKTFTFTLHRVEDGTDTSADVTKTITVPAGSSEGVSITFQNLRRGTYTVTEAVDDEYTLREITVLNSTNCYSTPAAGGSAMELTFVMGNNTGNANVIGKEAGERFLSYVDSPNGVYGAAVFTNTEIVYEGEIPVTKVWDDGTEEHTGDAVYLVLYKDGQPVLDGDLRARVLRLDAAGNWQGKFIVTLADKDDKVTDHDYSVREVSQISDIVLDGWTPAVLENDGTTVLYYEKAVDHYGITAVGGKGYVVQYEAGENGSWTVTNLRAVDLPNTGGLGTQQYTISGLLLLAAALVYGYSRRRKRERGASQ